MKQSLSHTRPTRPLRRRRYSLRRLVRANFYDLLLLLRESWVVLAGFGLVTLAGTLYLNLNNDLSLPAAFYETLKMLTLQSGLPLPTDPLGMALFFLVPLLGLALIFQSVLNFGRLLLDKGSRREAWQVALASTYRDHVIVCGLGRVGLRVVTQLIEAGYEPVAVEQDWNSEFVERVVNLKVPVVLGDAREPKTLREAGLMRARAVVSGINDDLLNIELGLTARVERPGIRVILRVFSEELDRNLERTFGANSAFSASALAAPTFAAAAVSREIDYVLPGDEPLGVTQIVVQPDSQMSGFAHQIEQNHGIRVLHHRDSAGQPLGRASMRQLNSGDQVTLIGSVAALESLRLKNVQGSKLGFLRSQPLQHPTEQFDTVIICGLGKVGYRVVRQLHQLHPQPRIVIVRLDEVRTEFSQQLASLDSVTTVIGDARDPDVLRRAGIERAYTVAALTSDDLLNLQTGLAARRLRPDVHVVLRVFSGALAEKLADMFGIRTIYSTSELAAPTLAAAAVLGEISHAFCVAGSLYSADRVIVRAGDPLAGQSIEAIHAQHQALVIGLRRSAESLALPAPDQLVDDGDEITLLAPIETLARIRSSLLPRTENQEPGTEKRDLDHRPPTTEDRG
jgi:Trk K+ transport system NAD-binding subunit